MSSRWYLTEQESGLVVVRELEIADGFWSRFWGLQFRASLPEGHGLLLTECGSIHTFWMRFSIDVVMIDASGVVLAVRHEVWPWRVVFGAEGTEHMLELPAGTATVGVGTRLSLQRQHNNNGGLPDFAARWQLPNSAEQGTREVSRSD